MGTLGLLLAILLIVGVVMGFISFSQLIWAAVVLLAVYVIVFAVRGIAGRN